MQQQTQDKSEVISTKQLTPIEKLLADKIEIEEKCRIQEKKLNNDFAYIQDNTASLLLSGVTTLLFPSKNTTTKSSQQSSLTRQQSPVDGRQSSTGIDSISTRSPQISISDYMAIAKGLLPVAWEILQPIIIAWSIRKAKSMIAGFFSGNKRPISRK